MTDLLSRNEGHGAGPRPENTATSFSQRFPQMKCPSGLTRRFCVTQSRPFAPPSNLPTEAPRNTIACAAATNSAYLQLQIQLQLCGRAS
eukprot:CAMPEP_0175911270 /NCGR_PEP_ID=MMETSP0108-20121206/8106_1 /TAXON_ID=195067 ORGANISM="Goniomonas pacifica, Strain CCMP1869" /NCGR_SAMPLE_ID=MMETSP0108 /ASSEMBLY_ACC=CAM_ASM_000204 /LENGTH=88 /DNA_ID=CAMNT_0017233509 /DNA_START=184 /DNA_END=450 /DNA_ORIENTATION=+